MVRKQVFAIFVLLFVTVFASGCYTVLLTPGENISDKEYTDTKDIEPIIIIEDYCWECYYNPAPWWSQIVYVSGTTTARKETLGRELMPGRGGYVPNIPAPLSPNAPSRPYTPPTVNRPAPTTGGGTVTVSPAKPPDKAPDKVDTEVRPAPQGGGDRQRPTENSQPNGNRERPNSNSPTTTSGRENGGGRR